MTVSSPYNNSVGTPTCHSVSYSIPFHLTALLPPSVPQSTHTDLVNGSLTTTANHSLMPSFSVYFHEQRKRPPASVLHPTSHAYQLCQPANGRADWTTGDRNKRSPFRPTRFMFKSTAAPKWASGNSKKKAPASKIPTFLYMCYIFTLFGSSSFSEPDNPLIAVT